MNILIETYGCSANKNDSEIMAGKLERSGYAVVFANNLMNLMDFVDGFDVIILNTCVVKEPTLKRMERRIQDLLKTGKTVVLTGCMTKAYPERIEKITTEFKRKNEKVSISRLFISDIDDITKTIDGFLKQKQMKQINRTEKFEGYRNYEKSFKKYIKKRISPIIGIHQIAKGCIGKCSFCITKIAKGMLKSFEIEEIVNNIEKDVKSGCKEIWLTATDVGCYGLDHGDHKLVDLLKKITEIKGKFFVRIGMMNPNNVLDYLNELLEIYENEKFFKFMHIPLQSGSDKVLKEMKREYKTKDFVKIANIFKKKFPLGVLATDVITGFYNEDEKDFSKTIEIINETRPDIINISRFWPMPKTLAYFKMQMIKKEDKEKENEILKKAKERSKILSEIHRKISLENNQRFLNKEIEVLVDNKEKEIEARDKNYRLVIIKKDKRKKITLGSFCNVKIVEARPNCLLACEN